MYLLSGASAVESSKKTDTEERPRTTLIICPLSVLSNWIVSLHSPLKTCNLYLSDTVKRVFHCKKYAWSALYI